jgi:hypothetical protein
LEGHIRFTGLAPGAAAAHVDHGNAGVVVADLVVVVLPSVEVQVLVLDRLLQGRADVHVVEGLGVHVEEVGVTLLGWDIRDIVQVQHAGDVLEDLEGLNLGEVVEIASSDDAGAGVLLEDLSDKGLSKHYTY